MFSTRWRLFRLLGIPIYLDLTWLIILVLMTGTLMELFKEQEPGLRLFERVGMALVTALAFFACIVLHELGHAVVARATGLPIRGITLFLFGGVAELGEEPRSAGGEFVMAIAGPIVSAILGGVFLVLALAGAAGGWPEPPLRVFNYLCWINWTVLVFNLVPAFPLDGGRVLRSILWGLTGRCARLPTGPPCADGLSAGCSSWAEPWRSSTSTTGAASGWRSSACSSTTPPRAATSRSWCGRR